MFAVKRTDATDPDFIGLVKLLDAFLAEIDGEEHAFYGALNVSTSIKEVIIIYNGSEAIGCGAFKPFDAETVEIKRMFTLPAYRGRGVATQVLDALTAWAGEIGFRYSVLETGRRQPEAISLYKGYGFREIPNYGNYKGIDNSVCFRKAIPKNSLPPKELNS